MDWSLQGLQGFEAIPNVHLEKTFPLNLNLLSASVRWGASDTELLRFDQGCQLEGASSSSLHFRTPEKSDFNIGWRIKSIP